jgi:hypothetical protein
MLNVNMAWTQEFVAQEEVTRAVLNQGAVSSTQSKKGATGFKKLIKMMTG